MISKPTLPMSKLIHCDFVIYIENSSLDWVYLLFWIFHVPWTLLSQGFTQGIWLGVALHGWVLVQHFPRNVGLIWIWNFSGMAIGQNSVDPHIFAQQLVQNAHWVGRRGYCLTDNEWILVVFRGGSLFKIWKLRDFWRSGRGIRFRALDRAIKIAIAIVIVKILIKRSVVTFKWSSKGRSGKSKISDCDRMPIGHQNQTENRVSIFWAVEMLQSRGCFRDGVIRVFIHSFPFNRHPPLFPLSPHFFLFPPPNHHPIVFHSCARL